MTESDWNACPDPRPMLDFLQGKAGERKLRLFAVGCCRRVWRWMTDEQSRKAVEVAERFADGSEDEVEIAEAQRSSEQATRGKRGSARLTTWAAAWTVAWNPNGDFPGQTAASAAAYRSSDAAARAFVAEIRRAESRGSVRTGQAMAEGSSAEWNAQCDLLRCIFGPLPFRQITIYPTWLTSTVKQSAETIYQERAFDSLPILADALMDVGCNQQDILNHCRQGGEHCRGCWGIDLVCEKEKR